METIEKECKTHGLTIYYRDSKTTFKCKKCNVEAVSRRRRNIKLKAIEYKGGKCVRCGYNKCISSLAFHHLDPKEKDFGISRKGITRSWEKVKKELDKCILVCHNCHGEIHEQFESV